MMLVAGQDLLQQTRASQESAAPTDVEQAARQHAGLAYRVAFSVLRNAEDAEDATQDTFLRLLRYAGRLKAARDPAAFIARVAWRVAVDRSRRRQGRAEVSMGVASNAVRAMRAEGRPTDEIAASREMQALLDRLIDGLPRKLRDTLRLSTVEELRATEIAEILDIPEASVRTRLFRARKLLQSKLESLAGTRKDGRHER